MSCLDDMDHEMHSVALDMETADRLLAGAVAPEDAPPGYADVARLLQVVSAPPSGDELAHEAEIVAKVASAVRASRSSHSPSRSLMPYYNGAGRRRARLHHRARLGERPPRRRPGHRLGDSRQGWDLSLRLP
jgi:hypothetical protein